MSRSNQQLALHGLGQVLQQHSFTINSRSHTTTEVGYKPKANVPLPTYPVFSSLQKVVQEHHVIFIFRENAIQFMPVEEGMKLKHKAVGLDSSSV